MEHKYIDAKNYSLENCNVTVIEYNIFHSSTTWFCVNDLAKAFNTTIDTIIKNSYYEDGKMLTYHYEDKNPKVVQNLWKGNDRKKKIFIYESCFYHLVLFSKFRTTKTGENMRNWVFGKVIPSIYNKGEYNLKDDFDNNNN